MFLYLKEDMKLLTFLNQWSKDFWDIRSNGTVSTVYFLT